MRLFERVRVCILLTHEDLLIYKPADWKLGKRHLSPEESVSTQTKERAAVS